MKKTLLTAALAAGFAGFIGAAQAETSVTLYGLLDGGISYQRVTGTDPVNGSDYRATRTGMLSGGQSQSRWGLRGTEDLGENLRAIFVLESGFDMGNGVTGYPLGNQGRLFGRQATVGLESDSWGRLDFGRQSNIATKYFADVASPFGVDFAQARAGATFGAADSVRYDNMIMYQTPHFSGFQFGVGYSFNNSGNQQFRVSGSDDPNSRAWTAGLRYTGGPIAAALTYDQIRTASTFSANPQDNDINIKSWNLGASYDFSIVKLHLGFGQARDGWLSPIQYGDLGGTQTFTDGGVATGYYADEGLRVNSYTVGLSAAVGANGSVMASWGMADPRDSGVNDGTLSRQHIYSLGYTYALSKRTNLYAVGSYARHAAFQDDLKSTFVGAGIRHQF